MAIEFLDDADPEVVIDAATMLPATRFRRRGICSNRLYTTSQMKGQALGECYLKSNTTIFVTSFLETASGDIWIGTTGGLAKLENGGFKTFTTADDGMAGSSVHSLYLTLADKHQ